MKRISHHFHIALDDHGKARPEALEHEHLVQPGRRHAHYRSYETMLPALRARGMADGDARALALRLDRTAYTTLDFPQLPAINPTNEAAELAALHPEVRKSLS